MWNSIFAHFIKCLSNIMYGTRASWGDKLHSWNRTDWQRDPLMHSFRTGRTGYSVLTLHGIDIAQVELVMHDLNAVKRFCQPQPRFSRKTYRAYELTPCVQIAFCWFLKVCLCMGMYVGTYICLTPFLLFLTMRHHVLTDILQQASCTSFVKSDRRLGCKSRENPWYLQILILQTPPGAARHILR